MKYSTRVVTFFGLLLIACMAAAQQDPADPSAVPSGTYKMDKNHAYLVFSYLHMGFSHPMLRFTDFDSEIQYDSENIENSRAAVTIAVNSIDAGIPDFNEELASDKFLDGGKFPEITFATTSYKATGKDTGQMTGNLTIKGITRPVSLDVKLNRAAEHPMSKNPMMGFSANGKFNRSEFDMGMFTPMVGDELSIQFEGEFGKTK
jgi:polyisoprenoid-binding protein YceI